MTGKGTHLGGIVYHTAIRHCTVHRCNSKSKQHPCALKTVWRIHGKNRLLSCQ